MAEIVQYLVKKRTEHRRQCVSCMGTGLNGNGTKCLQCTNGVAVHWHETEISLLDALNELKLIKRNTNEKGTETERR